MKSSAWRASKLNINVHGGMTILTDYNTLKSEFGTTGADRDPLREAMKNVSAREAVSPPDPTIMSRLLAEEDALSEDRRLRDRIGREKELALHGVQMKETKLNEAIKRLQTELSDERFAIDREFNVRIAVVDRAIEARSASIEVLKRRKNGDQTDHLRAV